MRVLKANLSRTLMASYLVDKPIKYASLAPAGNCDWRAETLSLN